MPRFGPERRGGVTENGVVLAQDDVVEHKGEDFQLKGCSKMLFIEVLASKKYFKVKACLRPY